MNIQTRYTLASIALVMSALVFQGCGHSTKLLKRTETIATPGSDLKPNGSSTKNKLVATRQSDYENPLLLSPEGAKQTAPAQFQAEFVTTKGNFTVEVNRQWAPNGADRFYSMVKVGFFEEVAIFRAIEGFMFQFGIHGDPEVSERWSEANIEDDPAVGISNLPGYLTFAQTGAPNSRSTQMFVNLGNNARGLVNPRSGSPFVPFGKVVKGMDVVKNINTQYGETTGNFQGEFKRLGNEYVQKKMPFVDYIKAVNIVGE